MVFCSNDSLNDLPLLKSSFKNEVFKKGKVFINRFDDMKNIATTKLENWLEDENYLNEDEEILVKDLPNKSIYKEDKNFYSDNINFESSNRTKDDDPWI